MLLKLQNQIEKLNNSIFMIVEMNLELFPNIDMDGPNNGLQLKSNILDTVD